MRDELQNGSIDAIAFVSRGLETLSFENVAEVTVTDLAKHFGTGVAEVEVGAVLHVLGLGRIVKRRPAAFGIELLVRGKKFGIAAGAVIGAAAVFFELLVDLAVGTLGARFAEDAVLLGSEDFFPLLISLLNRTRRLVRGGWGYFDHRLLFFGVYVENGRKTSEAQGGREEENPFHIGTIRDFFIEVKGAITQVIPCIKM
jgi:hypothetical protein